MGDKDHRARAEVVAGVEEKVLHPLQALDIEVVGWLVEIEKVRRAASAGQRAGDRESLAPSAREMVGGEGHARIVEADLAEDDGREHLGLVLIAVRGRALHRRGGCGLERGDAGGEVVGLRNINGDGAARRADGAVVRLLARSEHA